MQSFFKKRSYNKMDTIFEKSLFHDQNDISNGNLIKKCFFKNFIVPVLQSIQNVDFVIKNSSFVRHFRSFSPFEIEIKSFFGRNGQKSHFGSFVYTILTFWQKMVQIPLCNIGKKTKSNHDFKW